MVTVKLLRKLLKQGKDVIYVHCTNTLMDKKIPTNAYLQFVFMLEEKLLPKFIVEELDENNIFDAHIHFGSGGLSSYYIVRISTLIDNIGSINTYGFDYDIVRTLLDFDYDVKWNNKEEWLRPCETETDLGLERLRTIKYGAHDTSNGFARDSIFYYSSECQCEYCQFDQD